MRKAIWAAASAAGLLFLAVPSAPRATGRTTEVLVLTTATKVTGAAFTRDGRTGRKASEIVNQGPETIWCKLGTSSGLAADDSCRKIPSGGYWSVPDGVDVYCITTVNQASTAATLVSEVF